MVNRIFFKTPPLCSLFGSKKSTDIKWKSQVIPQVIRDMGYALAWELGPAADDSTDSMGTQFLDKYIHIVRRYINYDKIYII